MPTRPKARWLAIALGALAFAGCGSDDGGKTAAEPAAIPSATADRLAAMSERIATELDAGNVCGAAERADELSEAVDRARLPARFSEVGTVATTLVDQVNCPPPPPPPPLPPPPPPEPKEEKKDKGKGDQGGYEDAELPGFDQKLPPGQAKKLAGDD